jgi:hypothetical protein
VGGHTSTNKRKRDTPLKLGDPMWIAFKGMSLYLVFGARGMSPYLWGYTKYGDISNIGMSPKILVHLF